MQVVSIATISITWVSMTASVFGQNLYFNIAETDIVRHCSAHHVSKFTSLHRTMQQLCRTALMKQTLVSLEGA